VCTRAGVGLLLKGVDDAVVNMHLGDTYHLVFGGDLGFGEKGRPSAPGKPRIPPNAELDFEVSRVHLQLLPEYTVASFIVVTVIIIIISYFMANISYSFQL